MPSIPERPRPGRYYQVRTREGVRLDFAGFPSPDGGYVLLGALGGEDARVHTLDAANARQLALSMLVALADATGDTVRADDIESCGTVRFEGGEQR